MKKIPTLFVRNPEDRKHVLSEVTPGCEWVLNGEGTPTRKYDGTCTKRDNDGMWWTRREIKPGQRIPDNFEPKEVDEVTGKTVGWEPANQSSFIRYLNEAIEGSTKPGTYELCGPKINGNPEGFPGHFPIPHGEDILDNVPLLYEGLQKYLLAHDYEGIVWHHPDGRMAKLKRRDFA